MALSTHLYDYVGDKVRSRGNSYYRNSAAQIIHGNKEELHAVVIGSNVYEVDLYRDGDTIHASCTCPYFEGERETCKHIWAVLLTAEKKGYLKGKGNTDPLRLEISFDDRGRDENEDDDRDEGENLQDGYGATIWPPFPQGRRHLRLVAPSHGWKDHLASLRAALQTQRETEKGSWSAGRQILYFVDAPTTLEGKGLVIEATYREMKKNGQWGQLKSLPDSYYKPEIRRDPEDQHIMALLLGSQDATEYYYGYSGYGYYGRGLFRILPGPVQEHLMERLCRTGRCFLRKTVSSPAGEGPLRWDDGEPWEFFLSAEKEASSRVYLLKGYLRRGQDRVALEQPALLVAGGLVFFEDRVSRLLDNDCFAWIPILRKGENPKGPNRGRKCLNSGVNGDAGPSLSFSSQ